MSEKIKDIEASLWISASAGTGKTNSLVDRILALLLNGAEPSKILCLTHTNAAASEMLERLSNRCRQLGLMSDESLNFELQNRGFDRSYSETARSLYEKSFSMEWVSIQTIHSFCFGLLERFPLETGLLPGIKLCSDQQRQQMINESINCVLSDEKYHNYWEIISEYTSNIHELLTDNIAKIQRFMEKISDFTTLYGDFFNLDRNYCDLTNQELNEKLFLKIFDNRHGEIFVNLAKTLSLGSISDMKNAEILRENSTDPTERFVEVFLTKETNEIRKNLCTAKIKDPAFHDRMNAEAIKVKEFNELRKNYVSGKANHAFFSVAKEIIQKFIECKRQNHCLDYDDIISSAAQLLENINWVTYKIDGGLNHILVDEAQDTSPEQWEIIKKISDDFFANYQSDRTIFVVGDEKQSIYSFHGADVRLFDKMHGYFEKRSIACGQNFHNILLNRSYRTTGNILSFVDDVFADTFSNVQHISNRNKNSGIVEIIDVFEDEDSEEELVFWEASNLKKQSSQKKLADYISKFIASNIEKRVFVESRNRAAEASDFLILFRHRDVETMKNIINALKYNGISATGIDRILLKDELIVEDLIVLAEFAIFQRDDLMCARCLKSPLVGMNEKDLMQSCLNRGDEKLWEYLQKNDELYKKYSLDRLENYIDQAFQASAYDFFTNILRDGTEERFVSRLGEQCLDVLHEFLDIVISYEKENNPSLPSFLAWFRSFEHEIKRESSTTKDAVRLMTVHASKGLQAPFVMIADGSFFRARSEKFFKTDEGILLWDFAKNFRTNKTSELYESNLQADVEESNRLLYVALTRAEDFLYVFGEKHRKALNEKCWYSVLKNKLDEKKFMRTVEFDTPLMRFGEYTCVAEKNMTEGFSLEPTISGDPQEEAQSSEIPAWFYKKLDKPEQREVGNIQKTPQMIYGDCVHLLLSEMPRYKNHNLFDDIIDSLLNDFDLSDELKKAAKSEAWSVFRQFDFLFDANSMSEISFMHNKKEGRIDKIAQLNGNIWIVDFKTGIPSDIIPAEYISQLDLYKQALTHIIKTDGSNIKTAILWTKSASLIEISV